MEIYENPLQIMDFRDFPVVLGKSECHSHAPPQDVCRPTCEVHSVCSILVLFAELFLFKLGCRTLAAPRYFNVCDELSRVFAGPFSLRRQVGRTGPRHSRGGRAGVRSREHGRAARPARGQRQHAGRGGGRRRDHRAAVERLVTESVIALRVTV